MKANSILNMSVSKEQHAFAKSDRFPKIHSYTMNLKQDTFNKLTDFDTTVIKGNGKDKHCFGSRNDRFFYSPQQKKHGHVGPANYEITDIFSPKSTFDRSSRFTFGVSRNNMKKSFIEEAQHFSTMVPGPDTYKDGPKFGELGLKQSMRPRLNRYGKRADDYSDFYRT